MIAPLTVLLASVSGRAEPPPQVVDFTRDIRPIFRARCVSCHGPDKQKNGLRLDRRDAAMKGGDSGPIIVPGKSSASAIIERVTSTNKDERMPPTGDRLTAGQVAALRAWIDQGARWDELAPTRDPRKEHWSFQPIKRPSIPKLTAAPTFRTPVDLFIASRLATRGLSLSAEADRAILIRRLKFDLLGLPPSPAEVGAFVTDRDPLAYEKLVDRYLASTQYGERWARHWLDVVRFAESHGFEMNQPRPNAWPYRDYVIRALNEDKPYDRFVMEQLAGDAFGADQATGFLVAGPWDQVKSPDVGLTLQQRADELHDMVSTTSSTFLGLTVGCARCHNHKFDPISQVDYYAMAAVFAGVQHGERALKNLPNDPGRKVRLAQLEGEVQDLERQLAQAELLAQPDGPANRRPAVSPRRNSERFAPVTAKFVRFTVLATNNLEPCIDELEIFTAGATPQNVALATAGAKLRSSGDYPGSPDIHRLEFINDGKYGNRHSWISNEIGRGWVEIELKDTATIDRVAWARDREGQYADRLAVRYRIEVAAIPGAWRVVASSDDRLAMGATPPSESSGEVAEFRRLFDRHVQAARELAELQKAPMTYAGRFTTPEPTHRLYRGDPTQKREPVAPAALSEFGGPMKLASTAIEPERRLALAKWIIDPRNPLAARVLVNRLWHYHFGQGIVNTPSDFGLNGAKPSHPELLDWLAAEFVAGGWRIKPMHRLIVLSTTYRQASKATPAGLAADADTRLLWRFPPRRLEAEALRDAMLAVTGNLDARPGGPGFDLFEPNTNYVKVYTPKKEFGPAEWRRMIYQNKPRMQLEDTFGSFDCPDGGQIVPKRTSSTTPLQALNLLNSRFMMQQADLFAKRLVRDAGADVSSQIRRGFALAFQREPAADEHAAAVKLVNEFGLIAFCRALLNANEFVYVN